MPLGHLCREGPQRNLSQARAGESETVPGLQSAYEPPEQPELVVDGVGELPEAAARRVMIKLAEKGYICAD